MIFHAMTCSKIANTCLHPQYMKALVFLLHFTQHICNNTSPHKLSIKASKPEICLLLWQLQSCLSLAFDTCNPQRGSCSTYQWSLAFISDVGVCSTASPLLQAPMAFLQASSSSLFSHSLTNPNEST